jgi:Lon protease-like protein
MGTADDTYIKPLPAEIPLFPLSGVLLLPSGQLPLNIFENRYRVMVEDSLRDSRLIGMIQPRVSDDQSDPPLFPVGCAGRITAFEETDDGRYLITLTGISRFHLATELAPRKSGYRRAQVAWEPFAKDMKPETCLGLDRGRLKDLLGRYFQLHNLSCDWEAVDGATDQKLITCLSMICPFSPNEKQALLEAACSRTRADMFMTMLEIAIREADACGGCH